MAASQRSHGRQGRQRKREAKIFGESAMEQARAGASQPASQPTSPPASQRALKRFWDDPRLSGHPKTIRGDNSGKVLGWSGGPWASQKLLGKSLGASQKWSQPASQLASVL